MHLVKNLIWKNTLNWLKYFKIYEIFSVSLTVKKMLKCRKNWYIFCLCIIQSKDRTDTEFLLEGLVRLTILNSNKTICSMLTIFTMQENKLMFMIFFWGGERGWSFYYERIYLWTMLLWRGETVKLECIPNLLYTETFTWSRSYPGDSGTKGLVIFLASLRDYKCNFK